jgi:formylmethanofuran dehydrogenase subunit D
VVPVGETKLPVAFMTSSQAAAEFGNVVFRASCRDVRRSPCLTYVPRRILARLVVYCPFRSIGGAD